MLNAVMLIVTMLSIVMLIFIMLSVVMLSVTMLSVIASHISYFLSHFIQYKINHFKKLFCYLEEIIKKSYLIENLLI
jgi:hypothetical protein